MKKALLPLARKLWSLLPGRLRRSPPILAAGTRLRHRLTGDMAPSPEAHAEAVAQAAVPPPVTAPDTLPAQPGEIGTLSELDDMLRMLDRAAAVSDDELRRGFATFRMRFPLDLPEDPDSQAYRDRQMQLYQWLHGKPYANSNEASVFDLEAAVACPFPYHTRSAQTVGNHLIGIGHVIRTLDLDPGESLLEFGPGWGNTTIALARMGIDVTAIDIEPNFVELIRRRAANKDLKLEVLRGDFSMIHALERRFDAVLFFECFHHCANHQDLVAGLDRIVAAGGKVLFAAEPILDEFPIPWGLRLDGESLWAIRQHGWLELGFQERYFRQLMGRHGWSIEKVSCAETPWGNILVATRTGQA